jgi:lipoate-protein ligase A
VLQHGAVPLYGDIARVCPLLSSRPDPARVRDRATTVSRAVDRHVSWEEAAEAVVRGFAEALNLRLELGELTNGERAQAQALRTEKYGTTEWTASI